VFSAHAAALCLVFSGVSAKALASPTWPQLESATPIKGDRDGSHDAAVIVAIEQYEHLPPVEGARKNAAAWYRYLTESLGIPSRRISALQDENAEEYAIREALTTRVAQVQSGGRLWFVFIGHGSPSEVDHKHGRDGLLVTYGARATAAGVAARSLRRSELLKQLSTTPGEAIAVLDACFSGADQAGKQIVPGLQPLTVVNTSAPRGVLLLTAAQAGEFAGPLPGAARPAFSYLLLGALRGWGDSNHDGSVTGEEAVAYVGDALTSALQGTRSQHPTIAGLTKDKPLAPARERGPRLQVTNPFALADEEAPSDDSVSRGPSEVRPAVKSSRGKSNGAPDRGLPIAADGSDPWSDRRPLQK
jgi:hypothetical protein